MHDSYGSLACAAHDMTTLRCNGVQNAPSFCAQSWCFVDRNMCRRSDRYFRSTLSYQHHEHVTDLFYSYSTCLPEGQQAVDTFQSDFFTRSQRGKNVTIGFPISNPMHFKRGADGNPIMGLGDAYLNDSIPWDGVFVNYVNALVARTPWASVTFTGISGGARAMSPDNSLWTAAVLDVGGDVVDFAASDFWVTAVRADLAAFSVPVSTDQMYLWVPRNQGSQESIWTRAGRVFWPFSPSLWTCVVAAVVLMSVLDLWLHRSEWRPRVREEAAKPGAFSRQGKSQTCRRMWLTLLEYLDRLGQSCMHLTMGLTDTRAANVPQQLAWLGWAGFVLLTITACTYYAQRRFPARACGVGVLR